MELFGPKCLENCTGHGLCDGGDCLCHLDWVGKACELPALCPGNCSGHGLCQHSQCFCDPGFNGTSCAIYSGMKLVFILETLFFFFFSLFLFFVSCRFFFFFDLIPPLP